MKEKVRVASGHGFWGDLQTAPMDQVSRGPIDYLVMDFLAEVTMSIMQKQKHRNPHSGFARDVVHIIEEVLPLCLEKGIKIVTNAGGANPEACRDAIFKCARKMKARGLKVATVMGDDILDRVEGFATDGILLHNMDTGEPVSSIGHKILSANVYFGAQPIVEALRTGAQIVITGRTTDTGLTLAPMMHEFGWGEDDWHRLAAGTIAGHILECGGQATGGNFSADWRAVPDLEHIGFPIAEAYPNGEIVLTKHESMGGLVTAQTVKEQLLYEIGDPTTYITPDCVADFTTIRLKDDGPNRVRMSGVQGRPATDSYKVSMSYHDGYTAVGTLTFSWPDALEKAQEADRILRSRLSRLGLHFEEIRSEFLGLNSCHGPLAVIPEEINEVVLRVGVRSHEHMAVELFGKEIA
ncbi:MAG: DUF1446 domain-containing protein, partial [Bacteroidetes bacterium]|nr:DUF1446 domain-containing protein [Bacteroidota bacterium]